MPPQARKEEHSHPIHPPVGQVQLLLGTIRLLPQRCPLLSPTKLHQSQAVVSVDAASWQQRQSWKTKCLREQKQNRFLHKSTLLNIILATFFWGGEQHDFGAAWAGEQWQCSHKVKLSLTVLTCLEFTSHFFWNSLRRALVACDPCVSHSRVWRTLHLLSSRMGAARLTSLEATSLLTKAVAAHGVTSPSPQLCGPGWLLLEGFDLVVWDKCWAEWVEQAALTHIRHVLLLCLWGHWRLPCHHLLLSSCVFLQSRSSVAA